MLIGRDDYYKQIIIEKSQRVKLGDFVKIKIVQTKKYVLIGELIK